MFENVNMKFHEYKNWGARYNLHSTIDCQVDICIITKGGYSSWHYHKYKFNRFFVLKGQLEIRLDSINKEFCSDDFKNHYLIGDDCKSRKFDIKPGILHQFHALTNVELIEIYYTVCSEQDIIRTTVGGPNER